MVQKEFMALRDVVQSIDAKIASLLLERTEIIQHVKKLKQTHSMPIFFPEHEKSLLLEQKKIYHAIWREIFSLSKQEQGFVCYVFSQLHVLLAKYCLGCSTNVQCIDKRGEKLPAVVKHPNGTCWLQCSVLPASRLIRTISFFDVCDLEIVQDVEYSSYQQCYCACIFHIHSGAIVERYACYVLYPVSEIVTFDIVL